MCQPEHNAFLFTHKNCPHYPCHPWDRTEAFNCLFCYCPLYALGRDCGGAFQYTEKGVNDCSGCLLPHSPNAYEHINRQLPKLYELMKQRSEKDTV